MKNILKIVALSFLAFSAVGCQTFNNITENPKTTMGGILGTLGGAAAGSQVGKGTGRDIAMVGGALIGLWAGSEIGSSLDAADKLMAKQKMTTALNHSYPGERVNWQSNSNPKIGGYTQIQQTGQDRQTGRVCKRFQNVIYIDGQQEIEEGAACQNHNGTWTRVAS